MKWRVVVFAALGALVGCQPPTPTTTPTTVATSSIPATPTTASSPTTALLPASQLPVDADLTKPGMARVAVNELVAVLPKARVIKVDVSATTATVTFLELSQHITAMQWRKGVIAQVDSDVANIEQASFNPSDFNFDNLGVLFDNALRLGASSSSPELQIVEYNGGQVLMTVTTRPESATIFFRPDGSPIKQVDFYTKAGLNEALRDVLGQSTLVFALGYQDDRGVFADMATSTPGTIMRRVRPARLPAFGSLRQGSPAWAAFDPRIVDPALINELMWRMRNLSREPVTITVDNRYLRSAPTITVESGSRKFVTGLTGVDITHIVEPR